MSGIEVISLVITVAQVAAKIISVYGSAQNAPHQVRRLQRQLGELEEDEALLRYASERDRRALADMINRSRDLLEEHAPHPSHGTRIRNFLWPAHAETQLKSHNDDIHEELVRLYNRNLLRASQNGQLQPEATLVLSSPALTSSTNLNTNAARRFGSPRRDSVAIIDLPTTVTLQRGNGDQLGKKMHFDRLSIMERDETIRTIVYECTCSNATNGTTKRITHRIPRGTIRFEDNDLDDCTVSFLDAHDITIVDAEGYRIHRIHAEYTFNTNEERELFLLRVRERELIDRFFVQTILWDNGKIVAQEKVVRIWKKLYDVHGGNGSQSITSREKVTVSFMGRDQKQFELSLGDYKRNPKQDGLSNSRVTITSLKDSQSMIFQFRPQPKSRQSSISRIFGHSPPVRASTTCDAEAFKAKFMECHPATSVFVPLPSPAMSARSQTIPIQELMESSGPYEISSESNINAFGNVNWKEVGITMSSSTAMSSSSYGSSHGAPTELSTSPRTTSEDFAKEIERRFTWGDGQDLADVGKDAYIRSQQNRP